MKKVNVRNQVWLVGEKDYDRDNKRIINYYIETADHKHMYAFRQSYTGTVYNMCKNGIRINELLTIKSHNAAVMRLVGRTKKMMPYLADYYELERAV